MELEQTRRFCVDKIIAEGKIFSDLNPDYKPSQDENVIADKLIFSQRTQCAAARSIENLRVAQEDTDYLLIGFANGKILQLCVDLKAIFARAGKPMNNMSDYIRKAILDKDANVEQQPGLNLHVGPIWGA